MFYYDQGSGMRLYHAHFALYLNSVILFYPINGMCIFENTGQNFGIARDLKPLFV